MVFSISVAIPSRLSEEVASEDLEEDGVASEDDGVALEDECPGNHFDLYEDGVAKEDLEEDGVA